MTFHSSQSNRTASSDDVEMTDSFSRLSRRTTFVPKSPSVNQNAQYSLSFLEILNNSESKLEAIFNAPLREHSQQYQMQRDLWLYLVKLIKSKTLSSGLNSSNPDDQVKKKKKVEAHMSRLRHIFGLDRQ